MGDALKGKVVVITGSGRGMGRGIALLFAQEGARVVVNEPGVNLDGTGYDRGPADQVIEEIRRAGGEAVATMGRRAAPPRGSSAALSLTPLRPLYASSGRSHSLRSSIRMNS